MYIRDLIPRNFTELADAVPLAAAVTIGFHNRLITAYTVIRKLREHGVRARHSYTGPVLSHIIARIQWCHAHSRRVAGTKYCLLKNRVSPWKRLIDGCAFIDAQGNAIPMPVWRKLTVFVGRQSLFGVV